MVSMSDVQRHKPFSKQEFEAALLSSSRFMEYPDAWYHIEWDKDDEGRYFSVETDEIGEYCYVVPLTFSPVRILKVYSSVQRDSDHSRDVGGDAIRVVLADAGGEPKHEAYTRINRTGNWETKLRIRISQVLKSIGFDVDCPRCGEMLYLRWNRHDNSRFLGCSMWPDCNGTRAFYDGQ